MERFKDLPDEFKARISEWIDPDDIVCIWKPYGSSIAYRTYFVVADNGRETECLRAFGDKENVNVSVDVSELHKELKGAK